MAVLPTGFELPPGPYLTVIAVLCGLAVAALWITRPQVNQAIVVAFAPWMVAGAALYALYQAEVLPSVVAPFFGSPAVYLSTFAVAGVLWAVGTRYEFMAPVLVASVGGVVMLGTVGLALGVASTRGTLALTWPVVSVVVASALAGGVWLLADRLTVSAGDTGLAGLLVVFGHALDGVSTAVGFDVLHFGEQSPLSRVILEAARALPMVDAIGAGWLFVIVKLALAVAVVYLLSDVVRENPAQGYVLLGAVAAVGLGPGAHNVILFSIVG
ncbi:MAG: DUF63 family protein [Haloarculaceae archaeon]